MPQHAVQELLVGPIETVDVRVRPAHRRVQCGEHPPNRLAVPDRRDNRSGGLQPGFQRGELGEGDVGALQLAGRRQHVGGERGERAFGDIDHREHVERPQRGLQPGRLGKGGERVATGHEQRTDVSGFDLVDERDRRHLTHHAGKLRPARRWRCRSGGAIRVAATQRTDETAVKVHAGRTIERSRRDEHDPPEPLREHAVARHRDAGAALHRDATRRGAHIGDELFEERDIDVGGGRGPFDRERRERAAQCFDLGGMAMLAKLAFVAALREQCVRQRAEHRYVGAGPDGNVHVGERRGLGAARIEHPDTTAGRAVLAHAAHRIRERGAVPV